MPQLAATRRGLRRIVSFIRTGIFGLAFTDTLMRCPSWEPKVGLPAYCVEGNAAFGRQTVESCIYVFNRYPVPEREHPAFYNRRSGVPSPCVVCLRNQTNPQPKLKIRKLSYFFAAKRAFFDDSVRHGSYSKRQVAAGVVGVVAPFRGGHVGGVRLLVGCFTRRGK